MPSRLSLDDWGAWPSVRAGLIGLVLAVHACAATPTPRRIKPEDARTATAQEEIRLWLETFAGVGVQLTSEQLLELVNEVGGTCADLKKGIMAPFYPLLRLTGTGQSWALFAYPDRYPNRLVVEIREPGGEWEPVFRGADPEHAFLEPQIAFRRVRGVYDTAAARGSPGRVYDRFVDWVARETFAAWPDADDVRVKMVQFHVDLPYEPTDQEPEKTRLVRLRSREQVLR